MVARVALFGSLALTLIVYAARSTFISRSFLVILFFVNLFLLVSARVTIRLVARKVRSLGFNFRTVVIVGDTPRARSMARLIHDHPWWGFRLLGLIRERPAASEAEHDRERHPRPRDARRLRDDPQRGAGGRGDPGRRPGRPRTLEDVFLLCEEMGVKTRLVLDFFPHVSRPRRARGVRRDAAPDVHDDARRRSGPRLEARRRRLPRGGSRSRRRSSPSRRRGVPHQVRLRRAPSSSGRRAAA